MVGKVVGVGLKKCSVEVLCITSTTTVEVMTVMVPEEVLRQEVIPVGPEEEDVEVRRRRRGGGEEMDELSSRG